MKVDIETLKQLLKYSYESYESSIAEADKVEDYFHNRQFTQEQLDILAERGQPAESFNIIKAYTRVLQGYYSTQINTIKIEPRKEDSVLTCGVLNDVVNYVIEDNQFSTIFDELKKDLILKGIMVSYVDVVDTGIKDEFGRPKYKVEVSRVPTNEILLDPNSRNADYSDATFIHRYKWVTEEDVKSLYGAKVLSVLSENSNFTDIAEAEISLYNPAYDQSPTKYYLIVHTVLKSGKDAYSVHWSGETIISKKKVTYKGIIFPYRVQKLHESTIPEFYGLFRDIIATQDAINQAVIKIQLYVNSERIFYTDDAVENIDKFKAAIQRVEGVIKVLSLDGIKIESLTKTVAEQYQIINNALDRVNKILCINDSFLGMAFASDSGVKVNIQKTSSVIALRYMTIKIEQFYKLLGMDLLNLIKQYFYSSDVIRITDEYEAIRWVELNKPIMIPSGKTLPDGTPQLKYVFEEYIDPATGKTMEDEEGNIVMSPIPTLGSEIAFTDVDIRIITVNFNDEDEKAAETINGIVNGAIGNILSQVHPAGYFKLASMLVKSSKTKYAREASEILLQASAMLGGDQEAAQAMQAGEMDGQSSMSFMNNRSAGRPANGKEVR